MFLCCRCKTYSGNFLYKGSSICGGCLRIVELAEQTAPKIKPVKSSKRK